MASERLRCGYGGLRAPVRPVPFKFPSAFTPTKPSQPARPAGGVPREPLTWSPVVADA